MGGDGDLVVVGDDLPALFVLQLQHYLGADGAPALSGVLGPAELAAQAVAQGGDHIVHNKNGGQLPPGGVLHLAAGGAGGDAAHHTHLTADALQGGHTAPYQQVDVVVTVLRTQPLQAQQLRAAQRDSGVRLGGNGSGYGGRGAQSVLSGILTVHTAGSHQYHALAVEPLGPLHQSGYLLARGGRRWRTVHCPAGPAVPSGSCCHTASR